MSSNKRNAGIAVLGAAAAALIGITLAGMAAAALLPVAAAHADEFVYTPDYNSFFGYSWGLPGVLGGDYYSGDWNETDVTTGNTFVDYLYGTGTETSVFPFTTDVFNVDPNVFGGAASGVTQIDLTDLPGGFGNELTTSGAAFQDILLTPFGDYTLF